ncbi:MAG: glycosyltransferase [Egibacteraceae bacterium]
MRIALVSEHASPLAAVGEVDAGGQNVHVAALATRLGALGHDVVVATRRTSPCAPSTVSMAPGVEVMHVDAGPAAPIAKDQLPPFIPEFAQALRRAWAFRPPDVIHAHFWMSGWAARSAAPPRTPVLQTFHALGTVKRRYQAEADTSPAERSQVERELARSVDRVLATCSDEVRELLAMGADHRRIRVVPCGVDLARFHPDGPVAPRVPGRARVLAVGRLVPRKGFATLIRALPVLEHVELVVAGGPEHGALDADPEARRLRALARRLGVTERLVLRGQVTRREMPALLRSADLVAATPWYEPFGSVPLEAMACGVPVVASAVGGLLDSVEDSVTGLLVPPRDVEALAGAVATLLSRPWLRARMGSKGRARVERHYGWGRVAAATVECYRELAGTLAPAVGR